METELFLKMICYRRPASSVTEEAFIDRFLKPHGCKQDLAGNLILDIGDNPRTLWSSHTDTVHRTQGFQNVVVHNNILSLKDQKTSNCLGADCTTGIFIMDQMIKAKVPGRYIFHRGEEIGGKGSSYIADKTPELLTNIEHAVAFDRYGDNSVITHQFGRCCSDTFADEMVEQLPGFILDQEGIFTDTANYVDLIKECTNLSVGYDHHHTSREIQNLQTLEQMVDNMCNIDMDRIGSYRDYYDVDFPDFRWTPVFQNLEKNDYRSLLKLCKNYPGCAADLLEGLGVDSQSFKDYLGGVDEYY